MSARTNPSAVILFGALAGIAAAAPGSDGSLVRLSVTEGSASFVASTNVPAVSVKGKSNAVTATVTLRRSNQTLLIEHVEAAVPVKTLQTGMGVRDEHMRKYIFTTPDGQTPDMTFEAENVNCPAGAQVTCSITGNLSIRGVARPFATPVKVREDGDGFKVSGESTLKLSDYGIEQPRQFGVKTDNNVQVHLEFTAKPGRVEVSLAGGAR